ncbi:MAG: crotonase/enoyl-CoA hydratase family protein [Oligoflexales bacterium]|nr:crotonase/enoyl-CoA hydratase family protein [Oligoflexales bacterium]
MEPKTLKVQYEEGLAKVSLARPEKANAINALMWDELRDLFTHLSENKQVRAIILDAEGKNFCSGIELSMLQDLLSLKSECGGRAKEMLRTKILKLQESVNSIEQCSKPVIATIQGACIGGGVDLIAACDFRYATEDSFYSVKEAALGITADLGSLQRLPPIVGQGVTREWAYTCRNIPAQEALQKGFINQVFAEQSAMQAEALKVASLIATHPPLAIRGTKEALNYSKDHGTHDSLNYVATWNAAMLPSSDIVEALQAMGGLLD